MAFNRGGDYHRDLSAPDAIAALKRALQSFCQISYKYSSDNPPPGTNAANGFFRTHMYEGGELAPLSQASIAIKDNDTQLLYGLVSTFGTGIKEAFKPDNVPSNGFTNLSLFIESLENLGGEVGKIAQDIGAAIGGHPDIPKIVTDIKALIDKTKNMKVKLDGKNANGWIALNVKGVAASTKKMATDVENSVTDATGKKLAAAVSTICDQLLKIPEFKNDPWLYAEWQIQFELVMRTSAEALNS